MIERIDEVLEKKVRPALLSHEGDVQIVEYADGVLKIRLTGHCSGCPSARLTTEELIAAADLAFFHVPGCKVKLMFRILFLQAFYLPSPVVYRIAAATVFDADPHMHSCASWL